MCQTPIEGWFHAIPKWEEPKDEYKKGDCEKLMKS
jgi:hypothetical protein